LLGVLAYEQGQPERAIQLIRKALSAVPDFAPCHINLGNALRVAGRLTEAAESYRHAITLQSTSAVAHSNLARVLNEQQQFTSASESSRSAIALEPHLGGAYVNLGIALRGLGRLEQAERAYRQALDLNPVDVEAHCNLGMLLAEIERNDEARECYERAIGLKSNSPVAHYGLGALLYRLGHVEEAVSNYRRSVEFAPKFAEGWNGLGRALRSLGRFEEAATCFRRALTINPEFADAYRNLALTGQCTINVSEFSRLRELFDRTTAPLMDRVAAGFALGKLLDDAERFDEAFPCYAVANSLFKRMQADAGNAFDIRTLQHTVEASISVYTPEFFARTAGIGVLSELPVFIVGMPRSGTSLIEQIAASHPRVFGAGELKQIGRIAGLIPHTNVAGTPLEEWDTGLRLAGEHIERLAHISNGADRVIDKMPDNVFHLGVIAALFPGARIIFCRRDPRDTCLSCFFQLFSSGNLFSYDLEDCGGRYVETEKLIAHWRRVLPLPMLEIHYESVVQNLEEESRRLISFLGLDWDPACLDFDKTNRTVLTASSWQVRQPLFSRSVGHWRSYADHLFPLTDVLRGVT
jgi:tetratricopeptide (TPR) repeat protein